MKIDFENKAKGKNKVLSDKWYGLEAVNKRYAKQFPNEKKYYLEQADEAKQFAEFYKP
jgi:hypothetical protein